MAEGKREGGIIHWGISALGDLTGWALSSALRATHGLFGSKSGKGGGTDINTPGRTLRKKDVPK